MGRAGPPAVRLYDRFGAQPRLECALPDSKIAKSGIRGVSHVVVWRLVRQDKFVAVAIRRVRPRELLSDVPTLAVSAIECGQSLLQAEVLGPLAHEFATLFKQVRPSIGLLDSAADPMPEAQFGDLADLSRVLAPRAEGAADSMSRSAAVREHALNGRSGNWEDLPGPVRQRVPSLENADRRPAQWDDVVAIGL